MPVRPQLAAAALATALAACGGGGGGASDAGAADGGPTIDAARPIDAAPTTDARIGSSCSLPIELELGVPFAGDSSGFDDALQAGCSPLTAEAPDVVHAIALGADPVDLLVEVEVDEAATPPFDAVVSVRGACGLNGPCADLGYGERLEALAVTGTRFVVVDGTTQFGGASSGAYTLRTATRPVVALDAACDPDGLASRCAKDLRCVGGACVADSPELACAEAIDLTADLADGVAVRDDAIFAWEPDLAQATCAFDLAAGVGERRYRIDVAAPSTLVARTDLGATDVDTVLTLHEATCDGVELACADDIDAEGHVFTSRLEAQVAAGTYVLVVDGSSPLPRRGEVHLEVTLE